jgi:hypothetical protein
MFFTTQANNTFLSEKKTPKIKIVLKYFNNKNKLNGDANFVPAKLGE